MNQQAFYRDTTIGHFYLNPDGLLVYWSWGERRRTLPAKQHYTNRERSKMVAYINSLKLPKGDPWRRSAGALGILTDFPST